MILRNYNNFVNGLNIDGPNGSLYGSYKATLRNTDNEVKTYTREYGPLGDKYLRGITPSIFMYLISSLSGKGTGVFIGSGSTPTSPDDYKLESMIEYAEDGLKVLSSSVIKAADEDSTLIYVYTLKNNSSDPITVSEVGLLTHTSIYDDDITFMTARNVIDPEVLEPGQIKSFTVAIATGQDK